MYRILFVFLPLIFSCSIPNNENCPPIDPYSFFEADSVEFKKDLNLIATEQISPDDKFYKTFKAFVDTALWIRDDEMKLYYDSLNVSNPQLTINCILLFTDKTVEFEIKRRHYKAIWANRLLGCFWTDALVAYGVDRELKKMQNLDCYHMAIKSNKSNELHMFFLKMLIADYENQNGDDKYSKKLRKELIEKNFFKTYNKSF